MHNEQAIYLGFDYGTKRIGVAVGQELTHTASPLTIINVIDGVPNWQEVTRIVKEWHPSALIIGIPYHMDGTDQAIINAVRFFVKELEQRYQVPVYEIDERLTTKEARAQIFARGGYKALKKSPIDAAAAVLILESWLNQP